MVKSKRDKFLVNVRAFLPHDDQILDIIKFCKLEPTDNWRIWRDCLGYKVSITNSKRVIAIPESIKIARSYCPDIYFKSKINHIYEMSRWAMISFTKSNDIIVWLLGFDDRLRTCVYFNNDWIENMSPLACGMPTLRELISNIGKENILMGNSLFGPTDELEPHKSWSFNLPLDGKNLFDMVLTNRRLSFILFESFGVKK